MLKIFAFYSQDVDFIRETNIDDYFQEIIDSAKCCVIKIHIPKGARVLPVFILDMEHDTVEDEILLNKGEVLEKVSEKRIKNYYYDKISVIEYTYKLIV